MKLKNGSKDMNFFLVNYYLVTFGIVIDRQTDRQTDRKRRIRAHRALAHVGSKMSQHRKDKYMYVILLFFQKKFFCQLTPLFQKNYLM